MTKYIYFDADSSVLPILEHTEFKILPMKHLLAWHGLAYMEMAGADYKDQELDKTYLSSSTVEEARHASRSASRTQLGRSFDAEAGSLLRQLRDMAQPDNFMQLCLKGNIPLFLVAFVRAQQYGLEQHAREIFNEGNRLETMNAVMNIFQLVNYFGWCIFVDPEVAKPFNLHKDFTFEKLLERWREDPLKLIDFQKEEHGKPAEEDLSQVIKWLENYAKQLDVYKVSAGANGAEGADVSSPEGLFTLSEPDFAARQYDHVRACFPGGDEPNILARDPVKRVGTMNRQKRPKKGQSPHMVWPPRFW